MADNSFKLPLPQSLIQGAQNRAGDATQALPKAIPCTVSKVVSSSIVTVNFDVNGNPWQLPNLTIPVAWSEYTRLPVQVGCPGVARAGDVRLGGVTGLGTGAAPLGAPVGNLQSLVFEPVGTTSWQAVINGQTLVFYGEPNVRIQDKTNASHIDVTSSGITLSFGGHGIVINSSGTTIDGKLFLVHEHVGVQSGSSTTGTVA